MKTIKPTIKTCIDLLTQSNEMITRLISKTNNLPKGYIKSGTYTKFQKITLILSMDFGGLKRYVEDEQSWYKDLQIGKTEQSTIARDDTIDHFFRRKPSDFFLTIFSIFEDAVTRILEALDDDPDRIQKLTFEEKVKELKKKKMLPKKDDRIFCRFCMHIRNTIHSNSFFRGNNTPFKKILGEGPFIFQKNKPPDFLSTDRLLRWSEELVEIFEKIANSNDKIDDIIDNAMREDL